jgi:hypothetical protein
VGALGVFLPPLSTSPHVAIEPSALRAAKAYASNAPDGSYTKIYSITNAFAALTVDGSIMTWGNLNNKNTNVPDGSGYTEISSIVHCCFIINQNELKF